MQYIAKRFLIPEDGLFYIPSDHLRLGSDIVISDDTDEPMVELWIGVPQFESVDTSSTTSSGPTTIYSTTVIHDEDSYMDDIDAEVEKSIRDYNDGLEDDDWDY